MQSGIAKYIKKEKDTIPMSLVGSEDACAVIIRETGTPQCDEISLLIYSGSCSLPNAGLQSFVQLFSDNLSRSSIQWNTILLYLLYTIFRLPRPQI